MIEKKGRYGSPEKRRSPRHNRRLRVLLEYGGKNHEIRTVDISEHGVLIPRRMPPSVGTPVKVTIIINDAQATFEGIVKRHTKCLVNGVQTVGIGIDLSSPEYKMFVKEKLSHS